jgi:hypothetical protein
MENRGEMRMPLSPNPSEAEENLAKGLFVKIPPLTIALA